MARRGRSSGQGSGCPRDDPVPPDAEHLVEGADPVDVAAERAVVVERIVNSIGETIAGVGTEPKLFAGIFATSTITVMPPPGQT